MKKPIALILSGLLCATACIGAAGCANDGKTVLTVGILNDPNESRALSVFEKGFEALHEDVDVRPQLLSGQYSETMSRLISTHKLPDLVWTCGDQHTPYSSAGLKPFVDLAPLIARDNLDLSLYYDIVIDSCKLSPNDDSIWFAPRDYNRCTVYYNKDMFDAAEVDYPTDDWTWSDFLEICRALRTAMDDNKDAANGIMSTSYPLEGNLNWLPAYWPILQGFGAEFVKEDGTLTLDTAANAAAVEKLRELTVERLSTSPVSQTSGLFTGGSAAMLFQTRPTMGSVVSFNLNADFVLMPQTPGGQLGAGCSGYAISSDSEKQDLAWEFLKYVMSEEGQEAYGATGMGVPVLKSLAENGAWQKFRPELNHDAFVKQSERDCYLNYFYPVKPSNHLILIDQIADMITAATNRNSSYDSVSACLASYQTSISNLLK